MILLTVLRFHKVKAPIFKDTEILNPADKIYPPDFHVLGINIGCRPVRVKGAYAGASFHLIA